jgi:hypothetical protein
MDKNNGHRTDTPKKIATRMLSKDKGGGSILDDLLLLDRQARSTCDPVGCQLAWD